jgi:shikimate kinase
MEIRKPMYAETCDMVIDSSEMNQREVARRIIYENNAIGN